MTRADIIERMALDAYNRMRVRRGMKPVDYIGANHTPEANACREDMAAALSVLDDLIDREALDALIEGKAVVVPREETVEMYGAGIEADNESAASAAPVGAIYRAMLAASPYAEKGERG